MSDLTLRGKISTLRFESIFGLTERIDTGDPEPLLHVCGVFIVIYFTVLWRSCLPRVHRICMIFWSRRLLLRVKSK